MQEAGFAASCLYFLRHLQQPRDIKDKDTEKEKEIITINFYEFRASEARQRRTSERKFLQVSETYRNL